VKEVRKPMFNKGLAPNFFQLKKAPF